jgi:hypothetical protein
MEKLYVKHSEIENLKGVLFRNKKNAEQAFTHSLTEEQKQAREEFILKRKIHEQDKTALKLIFSAFEDTLTEDQKMLLNFEERSSKAYTSILKIETALAVDGLLNK